VHARGEADKRPGRLPSVVDAGSAPIDASLGVFVRMTVLGRTSIPLTGQHPLEELRIAFRCTLGAEGGSVGLDLTAGKSSRIASST
jgi:hypothetical protein